MFVHLHPRIAGKYFEVRRTSGPDVMAAIDTFLVEATACHGAAPLRPAPPAFLVGGAFLDRLSTVRQGIRKLEDQMTALDELAISDDERNELSAPLADEVLRLERLEEALVSTALAVGLDAQRRPDASPIAILEIEAEGVV